MAFLQSDYSRSATLDLRSAMARALVARLEAAEFRMPSGGAFRFSQVFEHWPSYEDRYTANVATVLPASWSYDAARLTPTLLEDTWEPKGQPGFGLYKLADVDAEFEVQVRSPTAEERAAVVAGLENLWVVDQVLMDHVAGARYGLLLPMPEYWGVCAGFALKAARVVDDEERAMRNHWEAVITLAGQAPQVKLGPVRPMALTVRLTTDLDLKVT